MFPIKITTCTLATASVSTRQAKGNDAISLLITLATNLVSVFLTPLWLKWTISMEADETVPREDVVDALGELANVVGGNVKALLPEHGTLGLPKVADRLPDGHLAAAVQRVPLAWRGHPFVVTVWEVAEPTGSVREGER